MASGIFWQIWGIWAASFLMCTLGAKSNFHTVRYRRYRYMLSVCFVLFCRRFAGGL